MNVDHDCAGAAALGEAQLATGAEEVRVGLEDAVTKYGRDLLLFHFGFVVGAEEDVAVEVLLAVLGADGATMSIVDCIQGEHEGSEDARSG